MKLRKMIFCALFAAILCVLAPITLPIGPIPLSLATFIIYLAAALLGWRLGAVAVLVYILIGAIGLPVFSGFSGGFQKIAGVTGGYIVGYIPCALLTGFFVQKFKGRVWSYPVGMVIGTILLYTLGTAWFCFQTGTGLLSALLICVVPFILGDAIKIAAVTAIAPGLRKRVSPKITARSGPNG